MKTLMVVFLLLGVTQKALAEDEAGDSEGGGRDPSGWSSHPEFFRRRDPASTDPHRLNRSETVRSCKCSAYGVYLSYHSTDQAADEMAQCLAGGGIDHPSSAESNWRTASRSCAR